MKRNNALYAVVSAVTLWGLLFLAGCSNVLITPPQDTKGKVTVSVNGGGTAARTLYPNAEFSKYELSFTPLSGQEGHDKVPLTDGQTSAVIDLAEGKWEVTAVGFVKIWVGGKQEEFAAAEGTEILDAGGAFLDISISATQKGDDGYFAWNVSFPSSKVDKAKLKFTNGANRDDVVEKNLFDDPTGQLKVAPGYYLVQVLLENGYQRAGHTEVVHIYANMETRADYSYTEDNFTDFITLGGKATVTLNDNTPDHAYLRIFSSQESDYSNYLGRAEIDLTDGSWSINMLPLDSRTTLYFWIAVEGTEGYFEKYTGNTLLVYDEDLKGSDWTISFSTITLSGTVDAQKNDDDRPKYVEITAYTDKNSTDKGGTGELGSTSLYGFADDPTNRDWSITIPDYTGPVYFLISFPDDGMGYTQVWSNTGVTLPGGSTTGIDLGFIKQQYTILSGTVDAQKRDGTRPDGVSITAYTNKNRTETLGSTYLNGFADDPANRDWSITIPGNPPNEVYFLISFWDASSGMGYPTELWSEVVVTLPVNPAATIDLGLIKQPTTTLSGTVNVTVNGSTPNRVQIQAYVQEDSEDGYNPNPSYSLGYAYADAVGAWSITIDPLIETTKVKFSIEVQENVGDNYFWRETDVYKYVQNTDVFDINLGSFSFITLSGRVDSITFNGSTPSYASLSLYANQNRNGDSLADGQINLSDGTWSIIMEPLASETTLYFWVNVGNNSSWQEKYTGKTIDVYNESIRGIDLGAINISTVTLSGSINFTVNGKKPENLQVEAYATPDRSSGELGNGGVDKDGKWSFDIEPFTAPTTVYFWVWYKNGNGDGDGQQKYTGISETIPVGGKSDIKLGAIKISTVTLSGTVSGTVNGVAPAMTAIFAFNATDDTLLGQANAGKGGTWSMDIESFKTSTTVKFIVIAIEDGSYLVIPLDESSNKTVPANKGLTGIDLTGLSLTTKPLKVKVTGKGSAPVSGQVFATSAKITAAELMNQSFFLKILGGAQGSGSFELPVLSDTSSVWFFVDTDTGVYTSRSSVTYTTNEIVLNLSELEELN